MNENIFIQNVDLNVSIENITQIKTELSLPCFKNLETLKEAITHHYYSSKSSAVFCNKKVQRIATKNTECCHPIFSLFSRQCVC